MVWTSLPQVVNLRDRSKLADIVVGTFDGFRRHLTGRNAAVLAYYGVLTIFPLLMAATTILGFVLEGDAELQRRIVDSAFSQIPVIGDQIESQAGNISGNWIALTVGLAVAIWSSMKAFVGTQSAFDDTWEVEVDDRVSAVKKRLRALIGIAVIGGAQVGNVVLASIVGYAGLPRLGQIAITVGGLAINVAVVAAMYRYLTSRDLSWSMVLPGALVAAAVFTLFQFAGTNIMARTLSNAESVYGDFAGLIALMTWISLHALVALVGAELNAAIVERAQRNEYDDSSDPIQSEPGSLRY
ncbi:MAG TPA: YihY/virulence factor BrkB family protein [Ilumatobacter sp.]|nr:YihY/virulence factor BrkB family protein [Ilumatobacter sp.]